MKSVFFFSNGNTVFCENDKQIPKLQKSWFMMYVRFLIKNKINPEECEFNMSDGNKAVPFKYKNKWNWKII